LVPKSEGADALRRRQWAAVWSRTRGFSFRKAGARVILSPDGKLACILAEWTSLSEARKGKAARRLGRCTVLLAKGSTGWRSLHTHFSLTPRPEFPTGRSRGRSPAR
jgi:ketosteroid isomerase-like protein